MKYLINFQRDKAVGTLTPVLWSFRETSSKIREDLIIPSLVMKVMLTAHFLAYVCKGKEEGIRAVSYHLKLPRHWKLHMTNHHLD
ncbi:unnamed protein product [Caretta caretta]